MGGASGIGGGEKFVGGKGLVRERKKKRFVKLTGWIMQAGEKVCGEAKHENS